MRTILKIFFGYLPKGWQQELKRKRFGFQIRNRTFRSPEKEFEHLEDWVSTGDWVLDIGANIGHYTMRLSEIVGSEGRVIAFEPVPETFELLVSNSSRFSFQNATLLQVGVSDKTAIASMAIPNFSIGLKNYYQAHMTNEQTGLQVLGIAVDDLNIPEKVSLVKIDAEGQDLAVLKGMRKLLARDLPVLIIEGHSGEISSMLGELGYSSEKMEGSWNMVFKVH